MMTRENFLEELKAALAGMAEEEREGVIAYYSEMIDDRMEAGMSEEAAVKAMEPVKEIASRVLEEAGIADDGGKRKPNGKNDKQEIRRPAESIAELHVQAECKRIRIISEEDTADVTLRYVIGNNDIFELHENDGVLSLEHKIRPVSSFVNEKNGDSITLDSILSGVGKLLNNLGDRIVAAGGVFSYEAPENEIEITLPKTFCGHLRVSTSNARISAEGLLCTQPIHLSTSNSRITADNVNCAQSVTLTSSNGRLVLNDVNADSLRLSTSNSRIEMNDVLARGEIVATSSNGELSASDTVAEGRMQLSTSNARVSVEDVQSPDISIRTSNGTVSGSIKGKAEDYSVQSATSNGHNSLGNRSGGEKRLHVVTSNSAITLEFEEE